METILSQIYEELLYRKKVDSQTDFADKLKYHKGYVSNAMKMADIPHKMQVRLIKEFGISKEYLDSNGKTGIMFPITKQDKPYPPTPEPAGGTQEQSAEYNNPHGKSNVKRTTSKPVNELLSSQVTKTEEDMNRQINIEMARHIMQMNRDLISTIKVMASKFPDVERSGEFGQVVAK